MGKPKKIASDASVNRQSKISTFFQTRSDTSGAHSSASRLFSTLSENESNKSKLSLKKQTKSEETQKKIHKTGSLLPSNTSSETCGIENDVGSVGHDRNKNVLHSGFGDQKGKCFEVEHKEEKDSLKADPDEQKNKTVLSQASSIIASITGSSLDNGNDKDIFEDSITCIPETQMDIDILPQKTKLSIPDFTMSPPFLSQNTSDPFFIPDTPQEKVKPPKKKSMRSFLSSSTNLTRQDPLHQKMKEKKGVKPIKTIAAKKPVGRTLEEAMKSTENDLEFASPSTICALTTGISFGREPVIKQTKNIIETSDVNGSNKKSLGKVVGSLSGIKRSSVSGLSPDPKRVLRKTPTKISDVSKEHKPRKFTKNLSKTFSRNILLKEESKCAMDSNEKDVHLDGDDDLASVLMDLKEVSPLVTKKKPERRDNVYIEKEKKDQTIEVEYHIPSHDEPDDALDDLISELRQNLTQSQKKTQPFKGRTEKSILSEGVSPRVFRTVKRQIKPDKENASPAKVSKEIVSDEISMEVVTKNNTSVCNKSVHDPFNDSDLGLEQFAATVEEELQRDFTALSPFKKTQSVDFDVRAARPHCLHYGRCKVKEVINEGSDILLHLTTDPGDEARQALLTGFWADILLEPGSFVHIIGEFDVFGKITITDTENLVIVYPDLLISGTSVVSGLYCMRRAVLNERFKGYDSKNIHMLHGTIIHSFFQQVVQQRQLDDGSLEDVARSILAEPRVLHDMYGLGVDAESVLAEIRKYIPQLRKWVDRYLPPPIFSFGQKPLGQDQLVISKIADIEENVWSPRYGIKGKIDLTVEVKIHDRQKGQRKKLLPLELKTGRPTHSAEHKGQVTLYSMMSSDRRDDPESGLLLYLKDGSMTTVPAGHPNKRGLVQLRNELAHHLNQTIKAKVGSGLPRPINNMRACSKCPHLLNCAGYKRVFEETELDPKHAMSTLVPETLAHLKPQHLEYYKHWIQLMMTELATGNKRRGQLKDLWCKTGWEREEEGQCLSGMVHNPSTEGPFMTESGQYIQEFSRINRHPSKIPLKEVGINAGDNLVVSAENEPMIALSMGGVMSVTQTTVTLLLDRDLHKTDSGGTLVYRLDKADTYNSMATNMTNLTRLMENTETSAYLRDIVIEKKTPEFEATMSKDALVQVKALFKAMNKPQKTAILKVLMCKDYVLIKGYPGTGKTSTIVNLVQILVLLGRSVLLTSYTHSAVDNILLKLAKHNVGFIRLGRSERIHPEIRPYSSELNTLKMTEVEDLALYYNSSPVVATTCLGVGTHPIFTHRKFDICIIDEASQVLQPACLGPLFVSKKFVLVGDPLQLPPVVQSHEAKERGMDESLFARLDETGGTYELNLQYRMNTEIMRLSNELVYNGALKCGNENVADGRLDVNLAKINMIQPKWIQKVLSSKTNVIFLDMDKVQAEAENIIDNNVQNIMEAEVVTLLAQTCVNLGVPVDEVGVITPYRQQVILLREKLKHVGVEVNTVDQYQGRDKCCIIVSFVKQTPGKGSGILEDLRRLNVALTRARHKLILVGSMSVLASYGPLRAVLDILHPEQIFKLPANIEYSV